MANDSSKRSNLVEILDLLKGEMDKFTSINNEMVENQFDFEKINHNYHSYSNEIDKSGMHITKLKRREFYENLFVYIGFFFFLSCVLFVFLRRFPIHKIISFIIRLLTKSLQFIYKNTVRFIVSNSTMSNSTLINNTEVYSNITNKSISDL